MRRATATLLVAALGTGCMPHAPVADPRPPVEVPEQYSETAGDEAEVPSELPERWWVAFGDPELAALVDLALEHNFQLGAAWARVEQAEALVEGASSTWWPQISAQLDVARRRQVAVFGALGRQEFENNALGLSVPVSYELDLWNRVGAQVAAAGIDVLATRDDVEALAITLAANVVETWLNVVQQRALRRLLDEQLDTNRIYLELVTLRFAHGLASALDVYQQRQQVAAIEAQLAQIEGSETVARQQLAVLIGRPGRARRSDRAAPRADGAAAGPSLPETGIPAHLLLRRPDVRAARRRVEAADWRRRRGHRRSVPAAALQRVDRALLADAGGSLELVRLVARRQPARAGARRGPARGGGAADPRRRPRAPPAARADAAQRDARGGERAGPGAPGHGADREPRGAAGGRARSRCTSRGAATRRA
ncbi:MAG: TolC family protein [Sandaracinaceae bacterium]|nr:TolC family protein [Sandaracinaceae bacterium]